MSEIKPVFFKQGETDPQALSAEDRAFRNSLRHWNDGTTELLIRSQNEQHAIDPLIRMKALVAGEGLLGWIRDIKEAHDLDTGESPRQKADDEMINVAICLPRSDHGDTLQSVRAYCHARGYRLLTLHEGLDALEEARHSEMDINYSLLPLIIGGNTEVTLPKKEFFEDESHTGTILFNGFRSKHQPAATFSVLADDFPFAAIDGPQPCFLITPLNKK